MRVAFLGLGIMGRSMAANLVKAGHEVAVWNRTAAAENGVEGARRAASPADAVQGAEVVWMCVSDTRQSRASCSDRRARRTRWLRTRSLPTQARFRPPPRAALPSD